MNNSIDPEKNNFWQILSRHELPFVFHFAAWPMWVLLFGLCILISIQVLIGKNKKDEVTTKITQVGDFAFYEGVKNQSIDLEIEEKSIKNYRYRIRVASFKTIGKAMQEVQNLKSLHPFNIERHNTSYGVRYRIYSNWFESKRSMNLFRSKLVNRGLDTLVHKQLITIDES